MMLASLNNWLVFVFHKSRRETVKIIPQERVQDRTLEQIKDVFC